MSTADSTAKPKPSNPSRPSKSKKKTKGPTWGTLWLRTLERSTAISDENLDRGRAYALHDWQLEVDIDAGKATALARSGPRIRNTASISTAVLAPEQWDRFVNLIAESSARTAALIDHELDPGVLDEAKAAGIKLLPTARSLQAGCTCRNWGELCKHSAAILYLLADVFDEAPFDLLLWRGMSYENLLERVQAVRSATNGSASPSEPTADQSESNSAQDDGSTPPASTDQARPAPAATVAALDAWNRPAVDLPQPLATPAEPATIPPYPSNAPPNAPFTGAGLHSLVTDAVVRAHDLLSGTAGSMLDLPIEADLGRRAALLENGKFWPQLLLHSGRSSRELSTKANAWRLAGAAGVEITQSSRDVLEINKFVQFRKNDAGEWFRFEKTSGRWQLHSGPAADPSDLSADDDPTLE